MSWCATSLRIWVQIFHRNIARTWFLFILSKSSEVLVKCCCFKTKPFETHCLMQGQFLQFIADTIDHNLQTLDCLNTFHGMGMIKAVTPGIKWTSRIIPCVEVTTEDVAAVAKVGIHFYEKVERFNIKYEKLPKISKDDNSRNTHILLKLSCLLYPTAPAWNGTMQLVHHG